MCRLKFRVVERKMQKERSHVWFFFFWEANSSLPPLFLIVSSSKNLIYIYNSAAVSYFSRARSVLQLLSSSFAESVVHTSRVCVAKRHIVCSCARETL